jgi:anthranilate phosphoribosyltransferase
MSTSLVLEVLGAARSAKEGVELARNAIDSGVAQDFLERLAAHFNR